MTRLLLVGGTGLVGGHALVQALADARIAQVIAPTRRPLQAQHAKLENPVIDFDALPAAASWWRVDAVVCALGTTIRDAGSKAAFRRVDVDYAVAIAGHARQAGACAFALNSSLGADPHSRSFYLRCKGQAERGVEMLGYPSLTFVRPSIIGGDRAKKRAMEDFGMRLLRTFQPFVPKRYGVVPAERIAHCLIEAALAAEPGVHRVESEAI